MHSSRKSIDLNPYYNNAVTLVQNEGKATVTLLVDKLGVGSSVATRLLDKMAQQGVIKYLASGKRKVI